MDVCGTAQTLSAEPPTVDLISAKEGAEITILGYGLLGTLVVICSIVYRETVTPKSRNKSMNSDKHKKEPSSTILAVQTEMALPRMTKSARIAELNANTARISKQPKTVIPGTVDKLIPLKRSPVPRPPY
jgi:hypothetical protein